MVEYKEFVKLVKKLSKKDLVKPIDIFIFRQKTGYIFHIDLINVTEQEYNKK